MQAFGPGKALDAHQFRLLLKWRKNPQIRFVAGWWRWALLLYREDGPKTSVDREGCPECGYEDPLDRGQCKRAIAALAELVDLKDGPRDDDYRRRKPAAWAEARRVLGRFDLDDIDPASYESPPLTDELP